MATGALVSVEEYLSTSYDPDCDYVDGVIEERNSGEIDHARLQTALGSFFYTRRKELGVTVLSEVRVQVSPTRFRIPDVCVVRGEAEGRVVTKPPFLCIEILSPEDRLSRLQQRVNDHVNMGVPYVCVIDPQTRDAWICTKEGMRQVDELRTENPEIRVRLQELFED